MQRLAILALFLLGSCAAQTTLKEWNGNFARGLYAPGTCNNDETAATATTPIGKMIHTKVRHPTLPKVHSGYLVLG